MNHLNFALRILTLFGLLTSMTVNGQELNITQDSTDLRFIVAGHVYGSPFEENHPFHPPFEQALDSMLLHDSLDFCVLTGDVVRQSSMESWNVVDSFFRAKPLPFIIAPGNHDLADQLLFKTRYGEGNYFFPAGKNLFVVLNLLRTGWNVPDNEFYSDLRHLCAQYQFDNVFIFNHHIFWMDETYTPEIKPNSTYARLPHQTFFEERIQEFTQLGEHVFVYGGDLGAFGDKSDITLHRYKNVHLIGSGMGDREWDNILRVKIENGQVEHQIIYLQGHDSILISPETYKEIQLSQ